MDLTFAAWRQVAASADGELLGGSRVQVLSVGLPKVPEPLLERVCTAERNSHRHDPTLPTPPALRHR